MNTTFQPNTKINITSGAFKAHSHEFYAYLRANEPVYQTMLPSKQPVWLITRYDDVVAMLKDERFAKNRRSAMTPEQAAKQPWMPGFLKPITLNMLTMDGADHDRLRGLVHKAFTPRLIENMRERIQTITDDLLDAAERKGGMDVISEFALPLPVIVIAEILGVPVADQHKFRVWSSAMIAGSAASGLAQMKMLPSLWAFIQYIRRLVQQRRANPQDDLTSALVQAQEAADQLTDDELVGMIFLLLVAGHETTVNLIGSGIFALLQHPDQMDMLRADPALIKSAIEELLRYTTPVEMADERFAREDVTVAGITIPRGAQVHGVIGSANRDENAFSDPDRLDLTRANNRHLSFGQGIHYCLGAPLARMEGQIAINTLLRRAPDLRLRVAAESLTWRDGIMLRGLDRLPVAF